MQALAVALVETLLVGLQAAWLTLGLLENLRHPRANAELVAEIMSMRRLRRYPALFAELGRNRVEDPRWARRLFHLVVALELLVALALIAATLLLPLAACGLVATESARALALLAVGGFTALWGGFLVGGQWFHYWAGSESLQQTHFFLTIWGVATLAVLI